MNPGHLLLNLAVAALLVGCAAPDKLCRVRSLSTFTEPRDPTAWSGSIEGIRSLLDQSTTGNVNLLYVHGIGWSQHEDGPPFGQDLALLLARELGAELKWPEKLDLCPRSTLEAKSGTKRPASSLAGGVMLTSSTPKIYEGDDPVLRSNGSDLGCLDRIVLKLRSPAERTITLHRFFWDDALWDSLEWPLVGYDDPVALLESGQKDPNIGYDDVDALRAPRNRSLKNNVITWGLTDAAAYLGQAGALAREGVGAAICAASSDREDLIATSPVEVRSKDRSWRVRKSAEVCSEPQVAKARSPFAVFSHSLGSRVVFDALTRDLDREINGVSTSMNRLPNRRHTVYLMANQIPLLAAGRLRVVGDGTQRPDAKLSSPLTFVAFSEINDLMTFELVPYFEHMNYLRQREWYDGERAIRLRTDAERLALVNSLGFDVVDVRLSFAWTLPIVGLAWPDDAHSNYFTSSRHVAELVVHGLRDASRHAAPRGTCVH